MSEILFLAPYPDIAQVARKICEGSDDITIVVARMEEAVEKAIEAERKGYHVLISRGVTSWEIKNSSIDLPVIEVSVGGYDIVRAYFEAKKIGKTIGLIDVDEVIYNMDLDSFIESVDEAFIKYPCSNNLKDISYGIQFLRDQGADVIMGKVAMANEARRQGMHSVVVSSGFDSVRRAIDEARRVNFIRKQEMKKARQFKAILDFSYDGIIALDKEGKITVFNKASEKITGWNAEYALGKDIKSVLPNTRCQKVLETGKPEIGEFSEIGDAKVIANRVPILVDHKVEGVVTTFQQIERLQKLENKVRRILAAKGFVAKYRFEDIIGNCSAIKSVKQLARDYAGVDSTVLIHGQTGSGKEMFAHAIHNASQRKNEPFIAINCAALPENLLESELFGYVEGAFTGARKSGKAGVFEMAHRGTLFLDEVGEMSPMLQARLLRVIEQGEVMRLGDSSILPVDVRLIAATHRDLRKMVDKSEFREDLFYRLNVLSLNVPPLKIRGSDIITIAYKFLNEFCSKRGKPRGRFSLEAENTLLNYSWPGNLRELRNAMERLALMPWEEEIRSQDIASALLLNEDVSVPKDTIDEPNSLIVKQIEDPLSKIPLEHRDSDKWINYMEKQIIQRILEETGGNKTETARRLGISRTTLWRKLQA